MINRRCDYVSVKLLTYLNSKGLDLYLKYLVLIMAVFMLMDVVLILLLRRRASTLVSTWAELNPGHSH